MIGTNMNIDIRLRDSKNSKNISLRSMIFSISVALLAMSVITSGLFSSVLFISGILAYISPDIAKFILDIRSRENLLNARNIVCLGFLGSSAFYLTGILLTNSLLMNFSLMSLAFVLIVHITYELTR